jgi:hypothetical protein
MQSNLEEGLLVGQSGGRSFMRDNGNLKIRLRSKIVRSETKRLSQGHIFSVGIWLLMCWQMIDMVVDLNHGGFAFQGLPVKAQAFLWALASFCLAVGLPLLTVADLDMNLYMARRWMLTMSFVCIYLIHNSVVAFTPPQPAHQVQWLGNLPFAYLLVFYKPVMQRQKGHPWFSELFTLTLALNVFTWAPIGSVMFPKPGSWPPVVVAILAVVGTFFVLFAYRWSQNRKQIPTMCCYMSIYAWLFMTGSLLY